ncbi:MAG TPA: hypothetical protein VGM23_18010, partial [Armatimonadota bacterium]
GWQFAHTQAFETAVPFLKVAQRLLPQNEDIAKLSRACEGLYRAAEEFRLLVKDKQVHASVKRSCEFWLAENAGQLKDAESEARFQEMVKILNAAPTAAVKSSVERIKATYPNIYTCGKQFYDQILTNIRHNVAARAAARNAPSESSGCSGGAIGGGGFGGVFLIYIIIRIIIALVTAAQHKP